MKFQTSLMCVALAILFCATLSTGAQSVGQLFTVNGTVDSNDAQVGDGSCADTSGSCTLRAAIQEANFDGHTRDVIVFALSYPAVINLSLGEIGLTSNLAIVGPGARRLTIQRSLAPGTPSFRIFRVASSTSNAMVRGFAIKNGRGTGAGILIDAGGGVSALDIAFANNNGDGMGGAILNNCTLTVSRSLFSANIADLGGGICNASASSNATVINSTFVQNSATDGGAIWNTGGLLVTNATFSQNVATHAGEAVSNKFGSGLVRVLNTIFGADPEAAHSLAGPFTSLGNNLVVDPVQSTGFVNGVNNDQVSDQNGTIDPMLGTLADNGGQTDTQALLTGSTAIDHGNSCVTTGSCPNLAQLRIRTDQRGVLRGFFSVVDIGAYENFPGSSGSSFSIFFLASRNAIAGYTGSLAVLTDASNNTKRYFPMNAIGNFRMPSLPAGTYVLETRTKRASLARDPIVISTDDFPLTSFSFRDSGVDLVIKEEKATQKP